MPQWKNNISQFTFSATYRLFFGVLLGFSAQHKYRGLVIGYITGISPLTRQWCVSYSALGNPYTKNSSSLDARRRLSRATNSDSSGVLANATHCSEAASVASRHHRADCKQCDVIHKTGNSLHIVWQLRHSRTSHGHSRHAQKMW